MVPTFFLFFFSNLLLFVVIFGLICPELSQPSLIFVESKPNNIISFCFTRNLLIGQHLFYGPWTATNTKLQYIYMELLNCFWYFLLSGEDQPGRKVDFGSRSWLWIHGFPITTHSTHNGFVCINLTKTTVIECGLHLYWFFQVTF